MELIIILVVATVLVYFYLQEQERIKRQRWLEEQRKKRLQREVEERETERLRQKQIADQKEQLKQQKTEQERRIQQAKTADNEREIARKAKEEARLQKEKVEREHQADILRQQKLDKEKQIAQKRQQDLREAQRQQAEQDRLVEERRIVLLKRQQEAQSNLCETGTTYCTDLNRLYELNPKNFKFSTIRSLTSDCGVWQELENGVKQLETYEQLNQYIFSYGLMHQAKLQQAYHSVFSNNHLPLSGQPIEIIDYGCGQGIGTICLIDYIKEQTNRNCKIAKVKLIEPSILALKRAVLNTQYSLRSFNQSENIIAVNKELDDISLQDIDTQINTTKIHIFSNIIDVEYFDLYKLYHKIQNTQKGINIFICVSPNIMESRNQRLDRFQQYFVKHSSFVTIASRENEIPNPRNPDKFYKRYERIFKVHLGENSPKTSSVILNHLSRFEGDDDLPF